MKLLFFALAFVFQLAVFADHHGKKPLKALMITGGCCHDYKTQKNIISEGISERVKTKYSGSKQRR